MTKVLPYFSAVLFTTLAYAGPPFITDDPEPVDYQAWEVNYALTGSRDRNGTSAFLPQIDTNYGIASGVQFHVQPQLAYTSQGGSRAYGLGDTELGLKYRLTPESENADDWMASLYPLVEIPTGNASRNLGAGASSFYLPLWLQTSRNGWTTYGGGGYWVNNGPNAKNAWAGGWVALYQVTERLQFGGELLGKTADIPGGHGTTGFNLGGTYGLAKDYNLLFSAGRGLTNAADSNEKSVYLALQVLY